MSSPSGNDPGLVHLTQLAASGVAVPAALRAAAAEAGRGRSQRWLANLAERIERGESTPIRDADASSAFVAAVAAGPGGVVGSLGDYLAVRQSLADMRHRTLAALWGGVWLIAVAAGLGLGMLGMLSGSVLDLIDEFQIERPQALVLVVRLTWVALAGLLTLALGVGLVLLLRAYTRWGAAGERVCDLLPLAGRALAAIDLAEMCDAIARLLAAGHTYPDAFHLAASGCASKRLRRWLEQASAAQRQGASVDVVVGGLPTRAGVLPALVGSLGPAPDRPDQAWAIAARSFYRTADRRTDRAAAILPPLMVICAAATAWSSLSVLIAGFTELMQMIGGLS